MNRSNPIVSLSMVTILFIVAGCSSTEPENVDEVLVTETDTLSDEPIAEEPINYATLSTFSENGRLNAVIEIPAGTNEKIEYSYERNRFELNRMVEYMPYPANYGFIPDTYMTTEQGGDGDALDILVLSSYQPTGTVMEVIPIGSLDLLDNGEIDNKIIAVPADPELNHLGVWNLSELPMEVMLQLENWFTNYKGADIMEFVGWQQEDVAVADIQKWQK